MLDEMQQRECSYPWITREARYSTRVVWEYTCESVRAYERMMALEGGFPDEGELIHLWAPDCSCVVIHGADGTPHAVEELVATILPDRTKAGLLFSWEEAETWLISRIHDGEVPT
jgi:hypothetical protein